MLKVSGHRDQRRAQRFRSGDEIRGLGPPGATNVEHCFYLTRFYRIWSKLYVFKPNSQL